MQKTISIHVQGKVQGVYYRQSTKDKALELGITGLVRNERDGSVYIVATGSGEKLQALIEWCKQGPPRAVVTNVETTTLEARSFEGFLITRE
jgi:acylphosphatase